MKVDVVKLANRRNAEGVRVVARHVLSLEGHPAQVRPRLQRCATAVASHRASSCSPTLLDSITRSPTSLPSRNVRAAQYDRATPGVRSSWASYPSPTTFRPSGLPSTRFFGSP